MLGWGWKSVRSSRRTDHGTTNFQNVPLGPNNMAMRLQPGLSVTEGAIVQHATQPCDRLIQAVPPGSGNLEMRLQPRLSVTEGAIVQHAIQHVIGELRPEKVFPHTLLLLPPLLDYLTRKENATKVMCLSLTVSHFATTTGHCQSISTRSAN